MSKTMNIIGYLREAEKKGFESVDSNGRLLGAKDFERLGLAEFRKAVECGEYDKSPDTFIQRVKEVNVAIDTVIGYLESFGIKEQTDTADQQTNTADQQTDTADQKNDIVDQQTGTKKKKRGEQTSDEH